MSGPGRPETSDTIAALATPRGRAALGTLRLAGPAALQVANSLFHPWQKTMPRQQTTPGHWTTPKGSAQRAAAPFPARQAISGTILQINEDGLTSALDQGVLVFFPAAGSPVGEDLAEITAHGSPLVLDLLLQSALRAGARAALPGEFTYRAFLHGRLDALQAEAVDDLIRARTEHQARVAHRQQSGALSRVVEEPRRLLVDWLARLEGSIEFSASEAEDFIPGTGLENGLLAVHGALEAVLAGAAAGLALRRGSRVVLAGPVNAGKSSLFNALSGRDRAIVHAAPGTTRDLLEAEVEWDGLPLTLVDTAGEREGGVADPVESEGMRRGAAARAGADLVLWLMDASQAAPPSPPPAAAAAAVAAPVLQVHSKIDLASGPGNNRTHEHARDPSGSTAGGDLRVSARDGTGLDDLRQAILARLAPGWDAADPPLVTRLRQKVSLEGAVAAAAEALGLARQGAGEEIIVLPLQRALAHLAQLTGRGDTEEIYDRIFSSFCIGK